MKVTNLFRSSSEAKRYQAFRPAYHDIPFKKLTELLHGARPRTLDVACGTGHSTVALAKISSSIIGCDISPAMLAEARANSSLRFIEVAAEALPFAAGSFDLVNISMGIHWLDQEKFLREAKRVLVPGGHLSIDNYGFARRMVGNAAFREAHIAFYEKYLPHPPRHKNYPEESLLTSSGFEHVTDFRHDHEVWMDLNEFCQFLMTQSNFLNLSEREKVEIPARLEAFHAPFFAGGAKALEFGGTLKLYRAI